MEGQAQEFGLLLWTEDDSATHYHKDTFVKHFFAESLLRDY